ncbi:MAG: hypothetical protein ACI8P3_004361 [Saprospiraceae bacterium]|jgi:hypothetical protein
MSFSSLIFITKPHRDNYYHCQIYKYPLMNQNTEDHLPHFRVRPRFQIDTSCPLEELVEKIQNGLEKENAACNGRVNSMFGTLFIPQEDQHYWSPQLSLSFEKTETGTLMRGFYAPRPAVWTMFVFFYAIIGIAIIFILIFGMSYRSLGDSGAILWLIPVLVIIFLSLYAVAYTGQKMGHIQLVTLHRFLEECVGFEVIG